jgi:hypothetical protein
MKSGKPQKQAIAIALSTARKAKSKAKKWSPASMPISMQSVNG